MKKVTDPQLIAELNGQSQQSNRQPVSDPGLIAELNSSIEQPQEPMSKWEAVKQGFGIASDAVEGDAEFKDAGDYKDYMNQLAAKGHYGERGFMGVERDADLQRDLISLGDASAFGNINDMAAQVQRINPQADIRRDSNDNLYILEDGKQFYFNPPGLDGQDIGNAAQNTAVYALGGVAGNAAKGYGLLARMGATGVTEGGLNVAAQKMAGREDVNEKEALLTGLTGAAAEGITPMISKAWRWLKNQDVSNLQAGKVMAKEMGADLADDQAERLGKMVRTLDPDQVTPESILAHVELDQEPTMGTLTGNQKLLDREAFLRQSGRKSTIDQLELLDRRNAEGLTDSVLKQTPNAPNKIKGADRVGQAVQQKAADMDEVAKAAWDKIPDATASSGPITQAGKNIQTRFKNSTRYIDEDMTPAAYKAAEKIDKFSKQLEAGDGTVDWNRINLERKRVGNMYTAAKTKEDRAALRIVKEEFEKTYRDAFETHLFSGDPKVIDKLDDAVSASRDYFDMFSAETGDAGGKAVESWLDKGIPPEKIAETFFTKKNSSIKANAVPVMRKLKQVLGEDSESFKSVQEMAIQGVMGGKNKASMRTALRNAFDSDPTFMNELFDKKQLDFMARTLEFLDGTALKGVAGRSSGTTERIFRWINQNVSQDYSLSGMANLLKKAAGVITGGERRMMSLPLEQIKFNPLVPLSNQPAQQDE